MKRISLITAITTTMLALTPVAFAGASLTSKDTDSNGSLVGQSSSSFTGNGQYIGGHDAPTVNGVSVDQTTGPRSRPDAVNQNFPGSNNAGGNHATNANGGSGGGGSNH